MSAAKRGWLRRFADPSGGGATPDAGRGGWEVVIAALLGVAAVLTAFSAYQTELRNGDSLKGFQEAGQATTNSNQAYTQGNQTFALDQALFVEYAKAANAGDEGLTGYLTTLMRPELVAGIEWWSEQDTDKVPTPFVDENPEYGIAEFDRGAALDKETEAQFAKAIDEDKKGDRYSLITVILAAGLFLFGVAGVARHPTVRIGGALIGCTILVVSGALLLTI